MSKIFLQNLAEQIALLKTLGDLSEMVLKAGAISSGSIQSGGKLMFCGNGGSAADSQHLAAELTGRFIHDRRPLPAIALSTDTSALTCIGNDYAFEEIFSRQVRSLAKPTDVLIAISTSGRSQNVIRAAKEAKDMGVKVIGLLGKGGGDLMDLCDAAIVVPSSVTARIQECHILIGHTLCGMIEENLGLTRA